MRDERCLFRYNHDRHPVSDNVLGFYGLPVFNDDKLEFDVVFSFFP